MQNADGNGDRSVAIVWKIKKKTVASAAVNLFDMSPWPKIKFTEHCRVPAKAKDIVTEELWHTGSYYVGMYAVMRSFWSLEVAR